MVDLAWAVAHMEKKASDVYDAIQTGPNYDGANADLALLDLVRDSFRVMHELRRRVEALESERASTKEIS